MMRLIADAFLAVGAVAAAWAVAYDEGPKTYTITCQSGTIRDVWIDPTLGDLAFSTIPPYAGVPPAMTLDGCTLTEHP